MQFLVPSRLKQPMGNQNWCKSNAAIFCLEIQLLFTHSFFLISKFGQINYFLDLLGGNTFLSTKEDETEYTSEYPWNTEAFPPAAEVSNCCKVRGRVWWAGQNRTFVMWIDSARDCHLLMSFGKSTQTWWTWRHHDMTTSFHVQRKWIILRNLRQTQKTELWSYCLRSCCSMKCRGNGSGLIHLQFAKKCRRQGTKGSWQQKHKKMFSWAFCQKKQHPMPASFQPKPFTLQTYFLTTFQNISDIVYFLCSPTFIPLTCTMLWCFTQRC